MKIILDGSQQQEPQEQQQFVIIQSQSLAGKSKMECDDAPDGQDDIVYVLKDESAGEQPNVIQLDSNCGNQEQFVWIANEQGGDSSSQMQAASTVYTIKELNYAQVSSIKIFFSNLIKFPKLNNFLPRRTSQTQPRAHHPTPATIHPQRR